MERHIKFLCPSCVSKHPVIFAEPVAQVRFPMLCCGSMNNSATDFPPPKEQHERVSKLFGGYTAFVAALLVATFAKSHDYPRSWIVISLLALSLPSLVAFNLLDFTIRVIQGRRGRGPLSRSLICARLST